MPPVLRSQANSDFKAHKEHVPLILLTGANGYLAAWILKGLLEAGYRVRGTVRSQEKANGTQKLVSEWDSSYPERFESAVVPDITQAGAFDGAVVGVDGIVHAAGPFRLNGKVADVVDPAVKSTNGLLNSAHAHAPTLSRVVLTSSFAAIFSRTTPPSTKPTTFTEENWNEQSVNLVRELGDSASGGDVYKASKVLSERALWDFVKEKDVAWDSVTLCPTSIFGPSSTPASNPTTLPTSPALLYSALTQPKTASELLKPLGGWMDVRDVAKAHVLALSAEMPSSKEARGGVNRVILNGGYVTWRDILQTVSKVTTSSSLLPSTPTFSSLLSPLKSAESSQDVEQLILCDTTKMQETFPELFSKDSHAGGGSLTRTSPIPLVKTVGDCLEQWRR